MITPAFNITATERVLPRLALDFTTAALDSRVTFSRTTSAANPATYVASSGYIEAATDNQPRFDYDPVTLTCKGLLIEESRTNILTNSEDFSTWPTKTNVTIAIDQINAPTNTQVADKIEETAATGSHLIFKNNLVVSGTTYTCSVFLKRGERFKARLLTFSSLDYTEADFDLDLGTATGSGKITPAGNGWYRCSITTPANTTSANGRFYIYVLNDSGVASYEGILGYGIYAFGAQVEAGAFATSYIPTTMLPLTRNADLAVMTGTNFSDWFNASEGTFEITLQGLPNSAASVGRAFCVNDNTANNSFILGWTSNITQMRSRLVVGGATQFQFSYATEPTAENTLVTAYKVNSFAGANQGGVVLTDASGTLAAPTQFVFTGDGAGTIGQYNGHLKKCLYWPSRLTNAEVQAFSKG